MLGLFLLRLFALNVFHQAASFTLMAREQIGGVLALSLKPGQLNPCLAELAGRDGFGLLERLKAL